MSCSAGSLTHGESGLSDIGVEVDRADVTLREVLFGHGFEITDDGVVVGVARCRRLDRRSARCPQDYRPCSRLDTMLRPHHMIERSGRDVETRLRQTPLYRPELDLVVLDDHDRCAAYGLFWFDPQTATGLVEPMRTEDDHQRRGLGRYLLTAGIDLLARAGAERIKICYQPGNPAATELYRSVGFEPEKQTDLFSRRAT